MNLNHLFRTKPIITLTACALIGSYLSVFPSCASAQEPNSTSVQTNTADADMSDGPPEPAQKVNIQQVASDDAISQRLTKILNASKWVSNAKVKVEEGIVFLSGQSNDEDHSQWAANVARNTEDVVAVVNNIEVNESVDVGNSLGQVGESLSRMWRDFLKRLPLIAAGALILVLTWIFNMVANSVVRRAAVRSRLRSSLRDLLAQLTTFVVWLTGLMVAAIVVFPGMTPAKLLTVLGLSSVAIGFAFKDIFENFFAGVLILWRFPFDKGDFIECGEIEGKVEDITIRMSQIRQVDGQLVVVPNAMLFKNPVHVLTNSKTRRVTVVCGVAYDEDVNESRSVIKQAVESCESVSKDDPVEIFAQEFAASSVNFEVTWWTGSKPVDVRQSRDEVVAAVKHALDEANIEIPFPYRTLTFKQPLQRIDLKPAQAD